MNVTIRRRNGGALLYVPKNVTMTVDRYSHHAYGGPQWAEISARGAENDLWEMIEWLRCPVEIHSDIGDCVWWGYIDAVELTTGKMRVTVSLDALANRVAVAYSYIAPNDNTVGERRTTDWVDDTGSIQEYGIKELLYSTSGSTPEHALAARAAILGERRYPAPAIEFTDGSGEPRAILRCRGWFETLGWKYYQLDEGIEGNPTSGLGEVEIGHGVTGEFSFIEEQQLLGYDHTNEAVAQSFLFEEAHTLEAIDLDMRKVGTPTDNVVLKIYADDEGSPGSALLATATLAGGSISTALGKKRFTLSSPLAITPLAKYWAVWTRSAAVSTTNYFVVSVSTIAGYSFGEANVYAQAPELGSTSLNDEREMPFRFSSGGTISAFNILMHKVGAPADNVVLNIYADVGGSPGTIALTAGTVAAASIGTSAGLEAFTLSPSLAVSAGTVYWGVLTRSGTVDPAKYYYVDHVDSINSTSWVNVCVFDAINWDPVSGDLVMTLIDDAAVETVVALPVQRISSEGNELLEFDAGQQVFIGGTDHNNGAYVIHSVRDISPGGSELICENQQRVTTETAPGCTITSALRAAQGFNLDTPWILKVVDVQVMAVGAPSDNLVVEIYDDNTGEPDTLLASGSFAGTAISTDGFIWAHVTLTTDIELTDATPYHVMISRSGATDTANYYILDVTEGLEYGGGALLVDGGAGWITRIPDADLNFGLMSTEDTAIQAANIAQTAGQFFTAIDREVTSGILINQYRDGDGTGMYELMELLRMGTTDGRRMLATVSRDRRLRIYAEPQFGDSTYLITREGELSNPWGTLVRRETCPVGVWARLKDIIPSNVDVTKLSEPTVMFVEAAEYEPATDRLRLLPRSLENQWETGPKDG